MFGMLLFFTLMVMNVHYNIAATICTNFTDYGRSRFSPNCFEDESTNWNITEIVRSWGFTAEEHYLKTEDGYTILVERVHSNVTKTTPIILNHGMCTSALSYVITKQKSIAMILGNLGYDLWLINLRGTRYSTGHVNLTIHDDEYWKFSIHELGYYDVRSALRYVNEITKKKSIYIGFSLGTLSFFLYSSSFPRETENYVKGMIAMAPVYNFKGTETILKLLQPIWSWLKSYIYQEYHGAVSIRLENILKPFAGSELGMYLLQFILSTLMGGGLDQMDPMSYPKIMLQLGDMTSIEVVTHLIQILEGGGFREYDYGKEKNLEKYGSELPPIIDLRRIPVPVSIFVGKNDFLSTLRNAVDIYSMLDPDMRCGLHVIEYEKWGHIEFLIAKDIIYYLHRHIVKKVEEIDSGKCLP